MPDFLPEILDSYPRDCRPSAPPSAASGGFSGSQVWRVDAPRGALCLREWPAEHPDSTHLRYIHEVLDRAHAAGCPVPAAIGTREGQSFVEHNGHLWDLAPWLPGAPISRPADDSPFSIARLEAAMTALALFHRAVRSIPASIAPPPGLIKRLHDLASLRRGGIDQLAAAISQRAHVWPELAVRAPRLLDLFGCAAQNVEDLLRHATCALIPIQPCIRDIHRSHMLFEGERVTGILDFGAMRPDSVACDIARLLGSLVLDRRDLWQVGLEAYRRASLLTAEEASLAIAYDQSSVLLSGVNWVRWVFVDGRTFENRPGVLARFDEITGRLAVLADLPPRPTV